MTGARLLLHQTRFDLLAFSRSRESRFFTVVLPIIFLVIFATVFGNDTTTVNGREIKQTTYYVPNLIALGVVGAALTNLAIGVVMQREEGVLKRRRATPVGPWALIGGRALTAIVVSYGIFVVLMLVGRVIYGVAVPTTTMPAALVTTAVGAAALCCCGYAISTFIKSVEAATPVLQAIVLPLYFISGFFIPSEAIPAWLLHIADVFPFRPLGLALLTAFDPATTGSGFKPGYLAVILAWGVAGLVVASRRFSWSPKGF